MGIRKKKMDANWVARIKAEGPRDEWYDELSPIGVSLILRVSESGRKVWTARYRPRDEDKQRRFKLGEYPAMTLADARERVSGIHAGLSGGLDPSKEREEWKKAPSFGKLAEEYLERWAKVRKRSWEEDKRVIEHDLGDWEHRKARDITRLEAARLLDAIVKRGAPVQANRTLALIRRIFNWAIEEGILESNPCHRMKPRAVEKASERALSSDEIRKVWAAFEALPSTEPEHKATAETARDVLKLMLLTAQRGGEVKAMAWRELDLEAGWWSISSRSAKNSRSHRVPLSKTALGIIQARKAATEGSPWVFPGRGAENQNHITEIKKAVANARKLSGCDWTPHDLRRTASTGMGDLQIPPSTISRVLNHKDTDVPDVTWVYVQYQFDKEKRQALEAWEKRLREILSGKKG